MTDINEFIKGISPEVLQTLAKTVIKEMEVVGQESTLASEEPKAIGVEGRVCSDIASRQQKGIKKYGTTVGDNPLSLGQWNQHLYEELLDAAVYQKKIIEETNSVEKMLHKIVNYAISKNPDLFLEFPPSDGKDEIDSIIQWVDSLTIAEYDDYPVGVWISWTGAGEKPNIPDDTIIDLKLLWEAWDGVQDLQLSNIGLFTGEVNWETNYDKFDIYAFRIKEKKGD